MILHTYDLWGIDHHTSLMLASMRLSSIASTYQKRFKQKSKFEKNLGGSERERSEGSEGGHKGVPVCYKGL